MLWIIETYVEGLPIPSSSNLLISDVEEYLFGGFVNFCSYSELIISTLSPFFKFGSSCDCSLRFLAISLYPPKTHVVPEIPNKIVS